MEEKSEKQSFARPDLYVYENAQMGVTMKKLIKKITNYYREHGGTGVALRTVEKLTGFRPGAISYAKWYHQDKASAAQLQRQRTEAFSVLPLFSIVVPLYRTPEPYLQELISSVKAQTYPHWELCLSDGSGDETYLQKILSTYADDDTRIRVVTATRSLGIAENTNQAIALAKGDFVVFADHDDVLAPNALYECVKRLERQPETEVIYTDEDKISMNGKVHFDPQFKPDFNEALLCSVNYICHLFVVKKSLQEQVGLLDAAYDGAQDYDFILRCTEQAKQIHHIPKILYHWRCHQDSTAVNQESKTYAFAAGKRAIQAHYDRLGITATVTESEYLGLYRSEYQLASTPLVSIIIPNKDHAADLKRCIDSIEEKSSYKAYEYVIIENNSEEEATFLYYEELKKNKENVKIVTYEGDFNYSAINNFGVRYASGEYLLFLNNDTACLDGEMLTELLGIGSRADVGAVGARLYYGDDTIQHAGVILGLGGIAGHAFAQERRSATGYCRRIICMQDLSAVTAACMLVRKTIFDEIGGFDEELAVTFNDVDLCLRIGERGKRVIYNPYVQLYHYESKSRGAENTPEKVARFHSEIAFFEKRWGELLKKGDPYYNPNLTLKEADYTLKRYDEGEKSE